jgi:hypothetical protein
MKVCSVEGCDRKLYARGLCEPHYRRRQRTGSLSLERNVGETAPPKQCNAEPCARIAVERGYCHCHYLRLMRDGDVRADRSVRSYGAAGCEVSTCSEPHYARHLCRIHYRRLMRTGDVQAERPVRSEPSGAWIHHGYRVVMVAPADRWLVGGRSHDLEHRLVMARLLGRPLTPDESVHHRDGNRLRNTKENLELWSRWQPRGQRVIDKLGWAVEILQRYMPEALVGQLPLIMDLGGTPEQIRTAATALRGRRPRPLDDGGRTSSRPGTN